MMTRRVICWPATAARRSRKSSSMSRAGAPKPRARLRDERPRDVCIHARTASGRGHGAALSLPLALVMVAHPRADLLAGGAAVRLGLLAALHHPEFRFLRARRRHVYRLGADVGHPVS